MKYFFITFILVLLKFNLTGQQRHFPLLSEFSISTNTTFSKTYSGYPSANKKGRVGFGFGVYHIFKSDKRISLITGVEINQVRRGVGNTNIHHFGYVRNTILSKTCMSIPAGIRINMGKKIHGFLEAGLFYDQYIYGRQKGVSVSDIPDANGNRVHKESIYDHRAELNNTFGVYAGMGIRFSVAKFDLILKPDFKLNGFYSLYNDGDENLTNYLRLNLSCTVRP